MIRALIVFMVCWLATGFSAVAQQTAKWGQIGGWDIRVDRSLGNGCFALQQYEDGTIIRLGFDAKRKTIYFMLGNNAWRSLEAGKRYQLVFVFDGVDRYEGELAGTTLTNETLVFLDHSNVSSKFTAAFMERNTMQVYYQGSRIGNLSLRNTYAAIAEVVNCQGQLSGSTSDGSQNVSDPFQRGGTRNDPFSR
jgi:hypothetical protein